MKKIFFTLVILSLNSFFGEQIKAQNCNPATTQFLLEGGDLQAMILNGGDLFWDLSDGQFQSEISQGNEAQSVFAGAIWMGGFDDGGNLKAAAQTYRQTGNDFWPGPILDDGTLMCEDMDKIWSVNGYQIRAHINDYEDNGIIDEPIDPSLLSWPAKGNPFFLDQYGFNLPQQDLAPFFDQDNDGLYDPSMGDHPVYDDGKPEAIADEIVWTVFNDIGNVHTETGADQLGVEVQLTAYVFLCDEFDVLDKTLFTSHKIINKSQQTINDFRVGLWMDYDLGCYNNDYVGSVPELNSYYVYNGTNEDFDCFGIDGYGLNPPAFGTTFLNHSLHSFMYYNNDFTVTGNPEVAMDFYNYLSGLWKDGNPVTIGGDGYNQGTATTSWMFPDNPNNTDANSWNEISENNTPSDRRGIGATGGVDLLSGEIFVLDAAHSYHRADDLNHLENVDLLYQQIPLIQNFYDNQLTNTPCQALDDCVGEDCVWPGDVNNNGIVNNLDFLPLGLAYGNEETPRAFISNLFRPYQSADWTASSINLNHKFADCNGDDIVDFDDQLVIETNYEKFRFPKTALGSNMEGDDLTFEFENVISGSTSEISGPSVANRLKVILGNEETPLSDVHGLGFSIIYDEEFLALDLQSLYDLVPNEPFIKFHKSFPGKIDVAIASTNGQSIASAQDQLVAFLNCSSFVPVSECKSFLIEFKDIQVMKPDGSLHEVGSRSITLFSEACTVSTQSPSTYFSEVSLFPNPANEEVFLQLNGTEVDRISIFNTLGQEVLNFEEVSNDLFITTSALQSGVYFIKLQKNEHSLTKKISILH